MKYDKTFIDIANESVSGQLPGYFKIILVQESSKRLMYSYNSNIKFSRAGSLEILSNLTSKVMFSVEKIIKDNKYYAKFEIIDSTLNDINQQAKQMAEISKLYAIPTNKLIINLDEKGIVSDIINKKEIYDKWQELYRSIESDLIKQDIEDKEKQLNDIKITGNSDFSHPLQMIQSSFLHSIFFFPIYNIEYKTGDKRKYVNFTDASRLLQVKKIDHSLERNIIYVDKNRIVLNHKSNLIDEDSLLKESRKLYKDIMPKKCRFESSLNVFHDISLKHSIPLNINIEYSETITDTLKYVQTSEIKIL
jgi:hypothetical protein